MHRWKVLFMNISGLQEVTIEAYDMYGVAGALTGVWDPVKGITRSIQSSDIISITKVPENA